MPTSGFGDISAINSNRGLDVFRSGPRGHKRSLQARRNRIVWIAFRVRSRREEPHATCQGVLICARLRDGSYMFVSLSFEELAGIRLFSVATGSTGTPSETEYIGEGIIRGSLPWRSAPFLPHHPSQTLPRCATWCNISKGK